MTWLEFSARLGLALLLGGIIGLERQWRQRGAGLRTNALVSTGAAMFVLLSVMTPGDSSPTRIAAQVVSGIGFLGGGVIFREGSSIRGLDTAATLWCATALGCLSGAGFLFQAFVGSLAILVSNILLRPLANRINSESEKNIKQSSNRADFTKEPDLNVDQASPLDPSFTATYNIYEKKDRFRDRLSNRTSPIDGINQDFVDFLKQNLIDTSRKSALAGSRRRSNSNPKVELATAYFNLGSTRVQLDDKKGAIANLEKAAKLYLALSDKNQYLRTVELLKKISA
jgi:uncharacterized membrane protein YhiD involved in acid resistance